MEEGTRSSEEENVKRIKMTFIHVPAPHEECSHCVLHISTTKIKIYIRKKRREESPNSENGLQRNIFSKAII